LGDWRSVFIVQLPLTALALAVGWRSLPSTRERPTRLRIDWTGVALLSIVTLASLVAVSEIGSRWWLVVVGVAVTGATSSVYWRHSGRIDDPVLHRQHITRFPLRWIHLTSGLVLIAGLATDNYLPLYVQTTRGRSEGLAAFSLVFLTVGWTTGSVIFSRALNAWREADVILLGATLIVPALAVSGLAIALDWSLAVAFAGFACVGVAIGFVSTAGLTLLQASSGESEMGRTNAAHQFIRTLCITYGVALGGAILLLVVDRRVGDIDTVRDVLAGKDVELGRQTASAIGGGLAWTTLLASGIGVGCLVAARRLAKATEPM